MKINEPNLINSNPFYLKLKTGGQEDFANWLVSPTGRASGDEYYWQHQQDLQQSALSFAPLPPAPKNQQEQREDQGSQAQLNRKPDATEQALSWRLNCLVALGTPLPPKAASTEALRLDWQEVSRTLEEQLGLASTKPSTQSPLETTNLETKPTALIGGNFRQAACSFKNHYLFIRDKQVEFSLNTTELVPQQIKVLKDLVKEWLHKKGLELKEFIINGMKQ